MIRGWFSRGWFNIWSLLAFNFALLGTPLYSQFAYVTNEPGNSVSGYAIDPVLGTLTLVAGSPFATGTGPFQGTRLTLDWGAHGHFRLTFRRRKQPGVPAGGTERSVRLCAHP